MRIAEIFCNHISHAIHLYPETQAVTFVGGVACNKYIKERISQICAARKLPFITPSPAYCTDNAAMIAYVASYKASGGLFDPLTLDIC